MLESYLVELSEAKASEKGDFLRAGIGMVVVTDCREQSFAGSPRGAIIKVKVLKVEPKAGAEAPNSVGEEVAKTFKFDDGDMKKKAAVNGDFLRCVSAIATAMGTPFKLSDAKDGAKLKQAMALCSASRGVVLALGAYEATTKDGKKRFYATLNPTLNTPQGVAKNCKLLDENAPVTAFGA